MTDPISDMLIRIKNACGAKHRSLLVPYSNIKFEIADLLQKEGFIESISKKGKKSKKMIEISLKYNEKNPQIKGVARISKPSRRVYMGVSSIKPVMHGHGILVLSTPKGIMTDKKARLEHVGGEAMFKIW